MPSSQKHRKTPPAAGHVQASKPAVVVSLTTHRGEVFADRFNEHLHIAHEIRHYVFEILDMLGFEPDESVAQIQVSVYPPLTQRRKVSHARRPQAQTSENSKAPPSKHSPLHHRS